LTHEAIELQTQLEEAQKSNNNNLEAQLQKKKKEIINQMTELT
jgi:uncharacterized membrane protein (DUF106 family)